MTATALSTTVPTRRIAVVAVTASLALAGALGAVPGAGALAPTQADAAASVTVRSQTGNLFCKASQLRISCESRASGVRYSLSPYGTARRGNATYRGRGSYTLRYNRSYRAGRNFRIRSNASGFTVTNRSGHGFFIERYRSYRF
ncbi:MAG: hypothetical protein M0P31_03940 [Solirubrobacteraceae bacterium]|nr:hypothetical protein [Solirubrobacteraceae bacterium]